MFIVVCSLSTISWNQHSIQINILYTYTLCITKFLLFKETSVYSKLVNNEIKVVTYKCGLSQPLRSDITCLNKQSNKYITWIKIHKIDKKDVGGVY